MNDNLLYAHLLSFNYVLEISEIFDQSTASYPRSRIHPPNPPTSASCNHFVLRPTQNEIYLRHQRVRRERAVKFKAVKNTYNLRA